MGILPGSCFPLLLCAIIPPELDLIPEFDHSSTITFCSCYSKVDDNQ